MVSAKPNEDVATHDSGPDADETVGYDLQSDASADRFKRPSNIGRYVILDVLGVGGMGVVCTAYDPKLDRKVAIKLLRDRGVPEDESSSMTAGQARLFREAQALAKLTHPNVITVHDVDTFDGQLYIAMEYVEGRSLKEWLREKKQPWPEVLRVFTDAARGVAAAHAAEITHRDFKPANVLLGDDGRVRVLDFGLAKKGDEEDPAAQSSRSTPGEVTPVDDNKLLAMLHSASDLTLTQAGRSVGTPAYMAPEQHLGLDVGPWTDQFSFCVSLWEGLYGELPFTGDNLDKQFRNVVEGRPREPPKNSSVPAWIHKILLRGMNPQTRNRYPDMDSLIAALSRDPARVRRRWAAAAAAVVLTGGGVFGLAEAQSQRSQLCAAGDDQIGQAWNDHARQVTLDAFVGTGLSFAADTFERVATKLDTYQSKWAGSYRSVCEATNVRGEQSDTLMDARMACLQVRRAGFSALSVAFAAADSKLVEHAVQAAYALPDPEACIDYVPGTGNDVPTDPTLKTAVLALRNRVAENGAIISAGQYEKGLARAQEIAAQADALGHDPTRVLAGQNLGRAFRSTRQRDEGHEQLRNMIRLAATTGQAEMEARGWLALLYDARRDPAGDKVLLPAEAAVARAGDNPDLQVLLLSAMANLAAETGDPEHAREHYEAALALVRKELGDEQLRLAQLLGNYGQFLAQEGQMKAAREKLEEALGRLEAHLGPHHPQVAVSLNNLGNVGIRQKDFVYALQQHGRALEIRRAALRADHPDIGKTLFALAVIHKNRKQYADAEASYREAEKILAANFPPIHPTFVALHNNRAGLHRAQEKNDAALAEIQTSLGLAEKAFKPDSPGMAKTLRIACEVRLSRDEFEEALGACGQAESIWRKIHKGKPNGNLAGVLQTKADVQLGAKDRLSAVHTLEEVVAIHASLEEGADLGAVRFRLARVMYGLPARQSEALALARSVEGQLVTPAAKTELRGWLAHPKPAAE